MGTIETIFVGLWVFILVFGLGLALWFSFNWRTVKIWYIKNEGKILLFLTFALCAVFLIILDLINFIHLQ